MAISAGVQAMIRTTVDKFGRIDVLINNAGYDISGSVTETNEEDRNKLMAVNAHGAFYGCEYATR